MEKKNLNELNTEELKNKLKTAKFITGILIGSLIALFISTMYLTLTKKFTTLTIIPVALLPLVVLNLNSIKKIKSELQSRESVK